MKVVSKKKKKGTVLLCILSCCSADLSCDVSGELYTSVKLLLHAVG